MSVCTKLKSQTGELAEIYGEENPTADILDPDFYQPVFRGKGHGIMGLTRADLRMAAFHHLFAAGCLSPAPGWSLGLY